MDRIGLDVNPQVDMSINGGISDMYDYLKDYTTIVLQPNKIDNRNILTQDMVARGHVKYVIKYNYNLDGRNIAFAPNTVVEIDGGSLTNGGIVGNNTLLINANELPEEEILINIVKSGTWRASVTERMDNLGADEEDLTKVNDKIMLKDKDYEPLENSGLGRVYLRKNLVKVYSPWMYIPVGNKVYLLYSKNNVIYAVYDSNTEKGLGLKNNLVYEMEDYNLSDISAIVGDHILGYTAVGGVYTITLPDATTITSTELNNTEILKYKEGGNLEKNLLTQKMLNKSNTIYHIQYNFELAEDITVPANCVLEFDGGSISGAHTITGNNTCIEAKLVKIFGTDVTIGGTWNVAEAYPEWFGAKGDNVNDDRIPIQKAIDSFEQIRFCGKTYKIEISNNTGIQINKTKVLVGTKTSNNTSLGNSDYTRLLFTNNGDSSTAIKCLVDGIKIYSLVIEGESVKKGAGIHHYRRQFEVSSKLTLDDVIVCSFDRGVEVFSYLNLFTRLRCNDCNIGFKCGRFEETTDLAGSVTSNSFRLCSFASNSVGAIIEGVYNTMLNCTFDSNDIGIILNGVSTTLITPSFENNKSAININGSDNIIINSYHYVNKAIWNDYNEASEYIKAIGSYTANTGELGIHNVIEGIRLHISGTSGAIDTNSNDFKLITVHKQHVQVKHQILILRMPFDCVNFTSIYKVLNNVDGDPNNIYSTCQLTEDSSLEYLNNQVNSNSKCLIEATIKNGRKAIWNGESWNDSLEMNPLTLVNHNLMHASVRLDKDNYIEIARSIFSSTSRTGKSCTFIISNMNAYSDSSSSYSPIVIISYTGGKFTVTSIRNFGADRNGNYPDFISYTDNDKDCFAIKGQDPSYRVGITIISNRVLDGTNDAFEFPLTIKNVSGLAITTISPLYLNGGNVTSTGRNNMTFPKTKGFCVFDTDLGKPIWWDGTNWVDALGNNISTSYITKSGTITSGNVPEFDGTDGAIKDSGKSATSIP